MKIYVVALALISSALNAVEANKKPPPTEPPKKPPCYDKCSELPNFPGNCTNFHSYVYDACSISCSCDGFYGFYQEKDLTFCGKDKVCFNGYCTDIAKDANCNQYGECYVAISNSYEPCIYQCVHKSGCDAYEENRPKGTCCYNQGCLRTGKCDLGKCIVKGGVGCSRRYYWWGPYYDSATPIARDSSVGSGNPEGGSSQEVADPRAASVANAATGKLDDQNSEEYKAARAAAEVLKKSTHKNGPKHNAEMCKKIAKEYCKSDKKDKQDKKHKEKAFADAYVKATHSSDGSEQFGKQCAEAYDKQSH